MAKKIATRREILDRWRGIEEKDDVIWSDPSKQRRFLQDKEEWFSDAFNFLICLPKGIHIWCGSWDIMGPLLETFYNYYKDKRDDSPLKLLWKRISEEMRQCTQCICQHHQAQEMYNSEYELSSIGPLLKVMRSLDEERITQQLIDINAKVSRGEYDPVRDNAEVVSVMFEVLMFPVLLDDQSLVTEFQIFIEAIDESNELTLAGHQQYPGVYALFFLKSRRARSIGLRLARYMGKLRGASDLEPLQPLLKKCIGFLETEVLPSTSETSRPRVQLERINVWLGIKALLGFVEPPAFEEGILEQYPIFLSIVLNHVSDDSLEFTYAVNCLRLLFELLGCKLWLRTTLSPSMMRNTLLGQCFHTRNEKSHKEIFDLFQPFLQSLEALQDGEHEKQRRHFLYFLLHQVTMSSNFSVLMRKKACQISLLIILRGYKMNPPCPPYECVHMWGPSLICSLKNSSLHNSLRQPAFDLIQTIMVSDAAALTTTLLKCRSLPSIDSYVSADLNDDDEDELPFSCDVEEKDDSCWSAFCVQNKFTSRECQGWMCSPLLWFEALVEVDPSILPVSFSKAVFWSLSRLSMVEHEDGVEMLLSVKDWLPLHGGEISASLKWVVPTGSDDGGDGKESINSVKVSTMCIPLIKTFKRFTAHFVVQLELGEHRKQWTWEPRMGESMILLLVDPNDNVRQVDRLILEQVSNSRGLSCGLKFLCSSASSLSAIYLGLRHALKLVQLDSVISRFHNLHHFFFVIRKLLEDAVASPQASPHNPVDSPNLSNFSSQGGFLRHPVLNSSKVNANGCLSNIVDIRTWDKFSISLSGLLWPCIRRCLVEGKAFIDNKSSQMTSVRLLEILPIIFERLSASLCKVNRNSAVVSQEVFDFKWLNDLMDWGNSSLVVIARYWKQAVNSLLDLLKSSSYDNSTCAIDAIEKLVSHESVVTDDLKEQVSRLAVMLSSQALHNVEKTLLRPEPFVFDVLPSEKRWTALNRELSSSDDADVQILDFVAPSESKDRNNVIVLSDDEAEKEVSPDVKLSCSASQDSLFCDKKPPCADKIILQDDHEGKEKVAIVTPKKSPEGFQFRAYAEGSGHVSQKWDLDASGGKLDPLSLLKLKGINEKRGDDPSRKSSSHETTGTKSLKQTYSNVVSDSRDCVIKELVSDIENDPWEVALNSVRRSQSFLAKPSASVPKRQVIQLKLPVGNKAARLHAGVRRLRPPKLDDWYRPILEIDYFYTVGLSSANKDENPNVSELKEVPVSFQSPDHYVDIFRPLILEEFKAQLNNSFMEASSSDDMCCGSLSVLSVERIDDFHLVRCVPDERESAASRGCSENDLVLLTKQPLQNSTHDVHMVGKVERRENDNKRRSCILVIRFYLQSSSSRLNKARRLLIERSKWYVSRIMSITPQLREFQALSSLKDIPLLSTILKPNRSLFHNESEKFEVSKLPKSLEQKLKSSFNENQLLAISVAIGSLDSRKDFELSLIQGPPGTGKTRTIVAIVSGLVALLLQEKNAKTKPFCGSMKSSNNFMSVRPQVSQSVAVARAWQDAALARQLVDDGEKNSKSVESFERGRVLICAQSNAAVDELVSRISNQGLYGSDGKMYKPYLVRVGNSRTVHPSSLPFFIDTLVDHRLAEERMSGSVGMCDFGGDPMELRSNLEKLVDRIRFYEAKRASLGDGNVDSRSSMEDGALKEDNGQEMSDAAIGAKLRKLYEQKKEICIDLAAAQAREKKSSEELKTVKRKIRNSILKEAEIVLTTLSGCGGDLYGVCSESVSSSKFGNSSEHTLFDAVVIDEAAQALEPATLIPLQLLKSSGTRCIMVGDPKQLPATVLSNVASKFLYQCSMFERLQRAGHPVVMLTEQYRMHPEICRFPSLHFYDSKLLNGGQMAAKAAQFHETIYLGPYVFYDVIDGQERRGRNSGMMSLNNEFEVDAAVELLKFFRKRYPSEFVAGRIAIITPYKSQVSLLRSRVSVAFGTDVAADIEFNTVDGFQGREVDILILSTVRASDPHFAAQGINSSSIGFVADIRRMNVALTRARLSLWILGNANMLKKNENWAALIKDAKGRDLVIPIAKPYESIFKKPFSGSMVIPTPDRSHRTNSHLKHMKQVEKVKDNSLYADQYESNPMETSEWRTKYIRNGAERKRSRASDYVKDDSSTKRHRTSDAISKADSMSSQNIEPTMARKYVKDGEGKFKEKDQKQINLGSSSHSRKAKTPREDSGSENNQVHFLQETDANNKFKLKLSDGPLKSSENDKSKRKEVSIYPAESNNDERDVTEGGRASAVIETPKDAIAMRKQQRDAVDALLSSALISSKKPGTSSKPAPVTRPLSSSSGAVKPPKPRKASMLQDKETG